MTATPPDEAAGGLPHPPPAAAENVPRPTIPTLVWVLMAVGGACFAAAAASLGALPMPPVRTLAAVAGLLVLGDTAVMHIRFGHDQDSFTLSEIPLIIALVWLPVAWVVVLGSVCVGVAHAVARRSPVKVLFNALSYAVAALLAGAVFRFVAGDNPSGLLEAQALMAASAAFFLWNTTTIAWAVASSQQLSVWRVYSSGLLLCVFVWIGNTGVGVLLVMLASSGSVLVWAIPLLLGLLCLLYWSYLRAMSERDVWQLLQRASRELMHAPADQIGHVVVDHTPTLFSAEFVELLLVDDEAAARASVLRWQGSDHVELLEQRPVDGSPYWRRASDDPDPFEIVAANAPWEQRRELASVGLAKCLVAPLVAHDRCLGFLRLGFRGRMRLSAREMQVLTTFSNHVSATVHNSRMFETIKDQALRDPLTGLANRAVLLDHLQLAQARSARSQKQMAIIFLDLDRFKLVNDSLGHDVGDALLVAVAERIVSCLRPGDTAARLGGDEFVVLCEDVTSTEQALDIADRLSTHVAKPVPLGGQDVSISASVGVSLADHLSGPPESLLRDADTAMYQAKGRGRARCELFDADLRADAMGRLRLENDLRLAVGREELRLEYQPIVALDGQALVGVEALVRWHHRDRGVVQPADFIPVAEETGAIIGIGRWVIEEACRQLADWTRRGTFGDVQPYVSVNLSPLQLAHRDLVDDVAGVLAATGVRPDQVCFEITEGALVDDMDAAGETLRRLRRLGVRTALDDFGTGYSSLSYLQQLPVDALKFDRSFISRLTPSPHDRAVVASMVELAHALNLTVVAEGVETQQQLEDLRALRCDVAQGFHLLRPQSPEALERALVGGLMPAA